MATASKHNDTKLMLAGKVLMFYFLFSKQLATLNAAYAMPTTFFNGICLLYVNKTVISRTTGPNTGFLYLFLTFLTFWHFFSCWFQLKVPGSIASVFFSNFQRFWYQRKAHIFSLPLVNFTVEKCTVWMILMKMGLVMVTIIKLTQ